MSKSYRAPKWAAQHLCLCTCSSLCLSKHHKELLSICVCTCLECLTDLPDLLLHCSAEGWARRHLFFPTKSAECCSTVECGCCHGRSWIVREWICMNEFPHSACRKNIYMRENCRISKLHTCERIAEFPNYIHARELQNFWTTFMQENCRICEVHACERIAEFPDRWVEGKVTAFCFVRYRDVLIFRATECFVGREESLMILEHAQRICLSWDIICSMEKFVSRRKIVIKTVTLKTVHHACMTSVKYVWVVYE